MSTAGSVQAVAQAEALAVALAKAHEPTPVDFRNGQDTGGGRGMMGQILQKADTNGDRAVTQAEIDTFRAATVAKADASGEGSISLDEFEAIYLGMTRNRMVDAFQTLDVDGDGVVTQAEMDKRFGDIVARMDRNDDGQLDRADRGERADRGARPDRADRDQRDRGPDEKPRADDRG